MASASSIVASAQKKKQAQKKPAEAELKLISSTDSVSYAGGVSMTQGLIPFLKQEYGVDSTGMTDFIRGFEDAVRQAKDSKFNAYVAGTQIATQVSKRMLPNMTEQFKDTPDSINKEIFYKGFIDAIHGNHNKMEVEAATAYFKDKMKADKDAKTEKLYGPNRKAGEAFLAANAKKDSVQVLPDGLQYKILVKGTGETPKKTDRVKVKYEGKLIDGKVFDSSYKRGDGTTTFRADQVIKGWTEALTMMPVGSKWQIFIPYKLAYGERDMQEIKPYSALIFTVELVSIEKEVKEAAKATVGKTPINNKPKITRKIRK